VLASIHAWWTVALLVIFIGIVMWAFSSKRKQDFEEAARLPLDDDDQAIGHTRRGEDGDSHG
jgi:cytochrome c oxidase cbb3-type subunit 4